MPIIKKSVHIIDYEAKKVYHRNIPGNFDEYITVLIKIGLNQSTVKFLLPTADLRLLSLTAQNIP